MRIKIRQHHFKLFVGFSFVGLISTLISLALIYGFLKLLNTPLIPTYVGIYIATILLSFVLNSRYVFNTTLSYNNWHKYLIIYLSGMLLGTFLLWGFEKLMPFENYILAYLVLPFTLTWNFMFSYKNLKPCE